MKEIFLVREGKALVSAFPDDMDIISKFKEGEIIRATLKKSHSPKQHRAVFALATTVLENAPEDDSFLGKWGMLYKNSPEKTKYNFVKMCEVQLGYFDTIIKPDGTLVIPMSLKYDEMDSIDFKMFFNAYLQLCAKLLGVEADDLLSNYTE